MTPSALRVPVEGGELAVAVWGDPDAPPVLAVHGITASHLAWSVLARELPDVRLVAPDLRGRGRSRDLPAPYGLRQHAADLEAVQDHLDLGVVPVVGHSMGAFVSVLLAARRPESVSSLLLVDGGFPLRRPVGVSDAELPGVVLGPAVERLNRTFADRAAYWDFWRAHPAFVGAWSSDIESYADYDLVDVEGMLRPSSRPEAVGADALELYGPPWYVDALRSLRTPVVALRAPRGLLDQPQALYPAGALESAASVIAGSRVVEVEDVNHYTILMSEPGAHVVADALRASLTTPVTSRAKEPE